LTENKSSFIRKPHVVPVISRQSPSAANVVRGATTFSKLGVQFLGLGYCTEQNADRIASFVHCYVKSWGGPSNFWGSRPPNPPVVAPLNVVPKLVALATSLTPSISAMSTLDWIAFPRKTTSRIKQRVASYHTTIARAYSPSKAKKWLPW